MKRKDTIISITAHISTLAFNESDLMKELSSLGNDIRYYGQGTFDYYTVRYAGARIQNTALENRKIVIFTYELNISNSNYENNILINLCLNLQKFFDDKNLILNKANQC